MTGARPFLNSVVALQPLPLLDAKIETSPDCVPRASKQSLLLQLNKAASSLPSGVAKQR